MIQELQTGILDINNKYTVDFNCKQLDDIILKIIVYDKSLPADLSDYNCRLKAFKADQVPLIQNTNITIKENIIEIKASKQLTTTAGAVKAELQFINKTTLEKKSTFYINIEVVSSVLDVDGVISTPTCTILEEIDNKLDQIENIKLDIIEAVKVKNDLNLSKTDANNINNTLKITITNADNKKKEVETVINNASNKIKEVQDSTNTANSTKQAVDNSVVQANASKQALDTSKLSADNTKKEVDNSIKIADEKIEIIKNLDPEHVIEDVKNLKTKVLENTLTSITTDNTLTKLDNSENGFVHNMQIRGRTLQNVFSSKYKFPLVEFNKTVSGLMYLQSIEGNFVIDKTKTYTLISTINMKSASENWGLNLKYYDSNNKDQYLTLYSSLKGSGITHITKVINFGVLDINRFELIGVSSSSNGGDYNFIWENLMILEGDWSSKEIPPYFEGIKSVGEAEGNKISILTCGKNLVNLKKLKVTNNYNTEYTIISENEIVVKAINNDAYRMIEFELPTQLQRKQLKSSSTNIKESGNYDGAFGLYEGGKVIRFYASESNGNLNGIIRFKNIQLEEGTKDTSYEKYKEDKTEILTGNEPLRGLPNGVSDVVDFYKNELTRNVEKVVLKGDDSEKWNLGDTLTKCISFYTHLTNGVTYKPVLSDKFVFDLSSKDEEHIRQTTGGTSVIIFIEKSKLSTPDANGFKKLLKTWADAGTPLEVYYQRAEPKTEKLQIKDELQTFKDGYIQLDNAITPSTYLEYSTNIPSALGGLTKVVDKLVDDTGWIDLPLESGITIDSGLTPRYRKVNNQVFVDGSVKGIDSKNKVVGILPVGFRPTSNHYYSGFTNGFSPTAMTLASNGNISVQGNYGDQYTINNFAIICTNFMI
ncbi:hypothetical protein EXM65_18780 [Clostridium botulinum]|uniref:Uncharacterized protein n=1 Tax=Clostridium botulinum TaxID=1491 RepID=A0A6M0SUE3_CLOBO|nr:hypothetical protein [Clostridium botulinum]